MSWAFEQLQVSLETFPKVVAMVHDGRDVWVIDENGTTRIYNFWDASTNYEHLGQENYFQRNTHALTKIKDFTLAEAGVSGLFQTAVVSGDYVYVLDTGTTAQRITKWSVTTKTKVAEKLHTVGVQPVMCAANNKLWFTTSSWNATTQNELFYLDLDTWTFSSRVTIPGKHQNLNRDICDGLNGKIYVTSMNEHSVCRFNASTGAWIDTIRVNRHPYKLHANQRRTVYIASDKSGAATGGMITMHTQPDSGAEVLANFSACGGGVTDLWDDNIANDDTSGNLWFVGDAVLLGRLKKSNKDFRHVKGTSPGFTISMAQGYFDSLRPSLMTKPFYYEYWNGSGFTGVNVRPYLFWVSASGVVYAARLTAMVRVNSIDVLGTGMISFGQQNYYGDLS